MFRPCRFLVLLLTLSAFSASHAHTQTLKVGDAAPAVSVKSHTNDLVAFPPKSSWAVLAFYPKALTGG